jgi:outer membrane protein OmpA-like peptidoglycan-associated protein
MTSNFRLARRALLGTALAATGALWGCASPPPPPPPPPPPAPEPEVRNRLRFEDSPEGARAILPDAILFDFGKSALSPAAGPVLDLLKPAFDKARGKIIVEGHTDSVGSDAVNKRLSLERAERRAQRHRGAPGAAQPAGIARHGQGQAAQDARDQRPGPGQTNRRAEILFPGETVDSLGGREIEELAKAGAGEGAGRLSAARSPAPPSPAGGRWPA